MLIGVPKEIKDQEYRVGLLPSSTRELTHHGHQVIVETMAGHAIGMDDADYVAAGAEVVGNAADVFARAELIVKVKEPLAPEIAMLRGGQVLFTYLHLAADAAQTDALMASHVTAIAYETVTSPRGQLPLLTPMSEVAGRMSIQAGAHCLEIAQGGRGLLLGGVPGTPAARVVVIGGGTVGTNAARVAMGFEARVTVIDKSLERLQQLDLQFGPMLNTIYATVEAIERNVIEADLVIGAVLVPGADAPRLITRDMVHQMRRGTVIVDVAIDQGGCSETSRPTSHSDPTYVEEGVVHYCVTNMPGAVARTSTFALNNATLPYVVNLANKGWRDALADDTHFRDGLNVHAGQITHPAVAEALDLNYVAPEEAMAG